ncbi:GUN4 domain-containing protein [Crocosphaera chwakensis]|uniref:GUN4 domain-containing protein n=1 Tax=Crocosphaera chwakensis TaxID=2546361 RepID=UPI00055F72E3|nr:GUN4 domain-containing protein [Crocosphaera chwakensis]
MLNITKPLNKLLWTLVLTGVSSFSVLGQETPNNQSSLISPETEIDYTPLQEDLQQKQWLEANETTTTLLLRAVNREAQGWIPQDEVKNIACWDLKIIDDLWKQYSGGRFGFSVQFPIFVETGNRPGRLVDTEAYDNFGTRIGWRNQDGWIQFKYSLDYSLEAPVGHLPNPRPEYQITGGRLNYTALTQRMVECGMAAYSDPRKPLIYQPR